MNKKYRKYLDGLSDGESPTSLTTMTRMFSSHFNLSPEYSDEIVEEWYENLQNGTKEFTSKKKIFWMYATFRKAFCEEVSNHDWEQELEETLREEAKEAGLRWSKFWYNKSWYYIQKELK